MSEKEMSSEKKVDYLEVDEAVAGQNYVCLSFLSPENLIQDKQAFKCVKFLQSYCKDQKLKFDDVYNKYQDFVYKYEDKLQRDFDEKNNFQTSIRGLKVRGVFDTREAAEARAKKLSTTDSSFHTFIGQVGYWLPWDPNADKVSDEVFLNSQLNDMMEKYQENNINRDIFYEEEKRDKIKAAQEEVLRAKKKAEEERAKLNEVDESEKYPIPENDMTLNLDKETEEKVVDDEVKSPFVIGDTHEPMQDVDADSKDRVEVKDEVKDEVRDEIKGEVTDEVKGEVTDVEDDNTKKGSEVSEDIKKAFDNVDPWLQRKLD